jgi:hypothetical protein
MAEALRALAPPKEVLRMIASDDRIYRQYIDGLAFIHDEVMEFAPWLGAPRFRSEERIELLERILEDEDLDLIRENLSENWAIAQQIKHEAVTIRTVTAARVVEERASQFAADILDLFTSCQRMRQQIRDGNNQNGHPS